MKAKYKSRGVKTYAPYAPSGVNLYRLGHLAPKKSAGRGNAIRLYPDTLCLGQCDLGASAFAGFATAARACATAFFRLFAFATSIDSMIVGVGLAFLEVNILLTALTIGLATTTMAAIGLRLGSFLGSAIGKRAEILGGLVLIGIGTLILAEHLHFL